MAYFAERQPPRRRERMEPWPSASGPIGVSQFQSGKLKEVLSNVSNVKHEDAEENEPSIGFLYFHL